MSFNQKFMPVLLEPKGKRAHCRKSGIFPAFVGPAARAGTCFRNAPQEGVKPFGSPQ